MVAKFRVEKMESGHTPHVACIDIGYAASGVVILAMVDNRYQLVDKWVVRTKKSPNVRHIRSADDNIRRCKELFVALAAGINKHGCRAVAIEMPSGGARSAIAMRAMGLASGVVAGLDCFLLDVPFLYVTPADVKVALSGNNKASKEEMQSIAVKIYPTLFDGVKKTDREHIADAIGVSESIKDDPVIQMLRSLKANDS